MKYIMPDESMTLKLRVDLQAPMQILFTDQLSYNSQSKLTVIKASA